MLGAKLKHIPINSLLKILLSIDLILALKLYNFYYYKKKSIIFNNNPNENLR